MKRIILFTICLIFFDHLSAQFIKAGKIEFERRTNQHSFLEDENMFDAMIKESMPKFAVTYNDLVFDEKTSIFNKLSCTR